MDPRHPGLLASVQSVSCLDRKPMSIFCVSLGQFVDIFQGMIAVFLCDSNVVVKKGNGFFF